MGRGPALTKQCATCGIILPADIWNFNRCGVGLDRLCKRCRKIAPKRKNMAGTGKHCRAAAISVRDQTGDLTPVSLRLTESQIGHLAELVDDHTDDIWRHAGAMLRANVMTRLMPTMGDGYEDNDLW